MKLRNYVVDFNHTDRFLENENKNMLFQFIDRLN